MAVKYIPVKNWILVFLLCKLFPLLCLSQVSDAEIALLQKLDSIKESPSIARHFASLYFKSTSNAVNFFLKEEEPVKKFIQRLETSFAGYFFRSAEAYHHAGKIPAEWKDYFADTSLSAFQYQLLGINAHINGDIWQALTSAFTLREIQENKKCYFDFQKGLSRIYRDFYTAFFYSSVTTRMLHNITLGLDKLYGEIMLVRWRKKQMQLAILYFTDPYRFNKRLGKLRGKRENLNRLILRHL